MRTAKKPARRPGKVSIYLELPDALEARLRARLTQTGATLAHEIRIALTRHLEYPPEVAPLPTPKQPKKL